MLYLYVESACSGGAGIPLDAARLAGFKTKKVETQNFTSLPSGLKRKKPLWNPKGFLYGIGRRPTLPPVGQYHRRGRA